MTIRFKCWLFGHKPERAAVLERVHLIAGMSPRFERVVTGCARCKRLLDVEWEEVRA